MNTDQLQEDFIRTANRFGRMRYESFFPDISRREYEMLDVIDRYMSGNSENNGNSENRGIGVSALAQMLRVSSPAVSRMIGTLEEKGYIVRNVDRRDRRNTCVCLTQEGREIRKETRKRMRGLMKRVMDRIGETDIRRLIVIWNRLADVMEEEIHAQSSERRYDGKE